MGLEEWYFGYLKNAFIPRYLLTLYRVHRVYHISFYSHFVQNKQSFITKKYSLYIVGEVRGGEALDMLQAMNTGHDGSLSTGHANGTKDMLSRLETMVLQGSEGLPLEAIRQQIASAVDIIIHLSRLRDKTRKTMEISEITGYEQGEIKVNPIYHFVEDENSTIEKVSGRLMRTENPFVKTDKLRMSGIKEVI